MIRRRYEEEGPRPDANKDDAGKLRLTLVPRGIIRAIARIRMYGIEKYPDTGEDGWRAVEKQRYRDAAYRHFMAYLDDPGGADPESGLPHLWHLCTNCAFLCELEDFKDGNKIRLDGGNG